MKAKLGEGNELSPIEYFAAAQDHARALPAIYATGHYALTIYVSGVAAECMFRAFRAVKGLPFRSDHALKSLSDEADFPSLVPTGSRPRFDTALGELIVVWRNSHRFRSNDAMRRFLKRLKLDRGVRGDFLKENARRVSSSAIELMGLGARRWRNRRN